MEVRERGENPALEQEGRLSGLYSILMLGAEL